MKRSYLMWLAYDVRGVEVVGALRIHAGDILRMPQTFIITHSPVRFPTWRPSGFHIVGRVCRFVDIRDGHL